MKHGITVREKKIDNLIEFIECPTGNNALRILSGIRINMNHEDYKASEEMVEESEIQKFNAGEE